MNGLWPAEDKTVAFDLPETVQLLNSSNGFDIVTYTDGYGHTSTSYIKPISHSLDHGFTETVTLVIKEPIDRKYSDFNAGAGFTFFKFWLENNPDGTVRLPTENPNYQYASDVERYNDPNYVQDDTYATHTYGDGDPPLDDFAEYLKLYPPKIDMMES